MSSVWLNINRNGRLGNRLFTRAHVYAAARELGATVVDWGAVDIARYFPNMPDGALPVYPMRPDGSAPPVPDRLWLREPAITVLRALRPRMTRQIGPYWSSYWGGQDPDVMRLDGPAFADFIGRREVVILDGYKLRCTPWVAKHADEIRSYFAFPQAIRQKWVQLQDGWHARWTNTVGVHMRATDFRKAQRGRFYLSPAEYASLLRHPSMRPDETMFVLFSDESYSDETALSELHNAFAGLNFTFCHGDLIDDLAGLASCDKVVGPTTSTYSRWAAFAGGRPWAFVARTLLEAGSPGLQFRDGLLPWDYA